MANPKCSTCLHPDSGICYDVEGENHGHCTEISDNYHCDNYEPEELYPTEEDN
jgi:hypothetical protein